jgi:hypothetical protein
MLSIIAVSNMILKNSIFWDIIPRQSIENRQTFRKNMSPSSGLINWVTRKLPNRKTEQILFCKKKKIRHLIFCVQTGGTCMFLFSYSVECTYSLQGISSTLSFPHPATFLFFTPSYHTPSPIRVNWDGIKTELHDRPLYHAVPSLRVATPQERVSIEAGVSILCAKLLSC